MNEPPARRERGVDQLEQAPLALQLAGLALEELAVVPEGPQRADVSAHARASDDVHLDAVLLENLQHTDVREAFRTAAGQREAYAAAANFPREPAQVELERHRPHAAAVRVQRVHRGGRLVEVQVRRLADLLDKILCRLRHLVVLQAEHEFQIRLHAGARGAQLAVELIELEEAVHRLLREDVGGGGPSRGLGERLARGVRIHVDEDVTEVPGAVTEEGGEEL